MLLLLLLLALSPPAADAATIYVDTRDYNWEGGSAPVAPEDTPSGDFLRGWLEARSAPRMREAPLPLAHAVTRYFKTEAPSTVKMAVLGAARSRNGHDPYAFLWIEWVAKSNFAFDLNEHRTERRAGIARVSIGGERERNVSIEQWIEEKDLGETRLDRALPWDAVVIARKMIDLHADRPRVLQEKADSEGRHAPY